MAESYDYVYDAIKPDAQLSSMSGGTDICSAFVIGSPMSPIWRGEIQCFGLGMAVDVFDPDGRPLARGKGELVCTKPFPSVPIGFWNDPDGSRFHAAYFNRFPNVWCHGDFSERTPHGGIVIHDDTSNLADLAQYAMHFCAVESCGKCTPCRIGSTRGVEVIAKIRAGDTSPKQVTLLRDLCDTMVSGSLCAMGGMTPYPVLSALDHFPEDFGLSQKPSQKAA